MRLGYVPLKSEFDNSVSHALEYYVADNALALWAEALGKADDARLFRQRSLGWRKYFSPEYGTLRPLLPDGSFLTPFNPRQGENFEPSPGFHEGNAWNYTFYVPHDVDGLVKLMGGAKKFTANLQAIFDKGLYDPANEPDIISSRVSKARHGARRTSRAACSANISPRSPTAFPATTIRVPCRHGPYSR